MIKHLRRSRRVSSRTGRTKGWGAERRARQAALIRRWQPWRHSTGPKTELGKARCALNGMPHAVPNAYALALRRARQFLRLAARNLAALRALGKASDEWRVANGNRAALSIHDSLPPIRYSPFAIRQNN